MKAYFFFFAALLLGYTFAQAQIDEKYLKMLQREMAKNFETGSILYKKGYCEKDDKLIAGIVERNFYSKDASARIDITTEKVVYSSLYTYYECDSNSWYKDPTPYSNRGVVIIGDFIYRLGDFTGVDDRKFFIFTLHAKNDNAKLINSLSLEEHKAQVIAYLDVRWAYMKKISDAIKEKEEQEIAKYKEKELNFGKIGTYDRDGIAILKKGNKYGLVDKQEQVILEPVYDEIASFNSEGIAKLIKDGKIGFFDKRNRVVVEPEYDEVSNFGEEGVARVKKGALYGFIDKTGKVVIPIKYDDTDETCSNALVRVKLNGKFGFVDLNGKVIVPIEQSQLNRFFHERCLAMQNKLIGVYDIKGRLVTPFQYNVMSDFSADLAAVKKDGKWGFIDKEGKVVIPLIYDEWQGRLEGSDGLISVKIGDKWGAIDKTGKAVLPFSATYLYLSSFNKGLAIVKQKSERTGFLQYGIINRKGELVVDLVYYIIERLDENGLYKTQKLNYRTLGQGLLDSKGEELVPPVYDDISEFSAGYAVVYVGGFCGYINEKGINVTPIAYTKAEPMNYNQTANVTFNGERRTIKYYKEEFFKLEPISGPEKFKFEGKIHVMNDLNWTIYVHYRTYPDFSRPAKIHKLEPGEMFQVPMLENHHIYLSGSGVNTESTEIVQCLMQQM